MGAKILLVEDEPGIRQLVTFNLTQSGYQVACIGDAESLESALSACVPDLVIVDWMLPGQSGITLIRKLRARADTKSIPIIMMTARSGEQDVLLALDSGADDYIKKPFSPREMVARVHAMLRRLAPQATDSVVEIGNLSLDPVKYRVSIADRIVNLTPTEFRLLYFFATSPERVHTRDALINKVWGSSAFINERTVDAHVGRLRGALHKEGYDIKIDTIRGVGYCFSPGS